MDLASGWRTDGICSTADTNEVKLCSLFHNESLKGIVSFVAFEFNEPAAFVNENLEQQIQSPFQLRTLLIYLLNNDDCSDKFLKSYLLLINKKKLLIQRFEEINIFISMDLNLVIVLIRLS